ncbi:MAG: YceD family protein [Gammaproteobacteria bacterium]
MLADHIGVPHLRDLASRSEQLRDSINLDEMSRLEGVLFSGSGQAENLLEVELEFLGGMQGYPEISGHIKGTLEIACQRCLGSLKWPVDVDFQLIVVGSEEDCDEIAEPFDAVVAGDQGIQLVSIIEDELLSSLPLAPMHATGDTCAAGAEVIQEQDTVTEGEETNRPFADLASLLKDDETTEKN